MVSRAQLSVVVVLGLVGAAAAACVTDYGKGLDDPNYGPPDALYGKLPPIAPSLGGGGVGGGLAEGGGGGAGLCDGKGPISDGGDCSVKWSELVAQMGNEGSWGCSKTGCHIAQPPIPKIDISSPRAAYDALAAHKVLVNGQPKPYINPCSKDPAESSFLCNVTPRAGSTTAGECGIKVMPEGAPLEQADRDRLKTWIECGAPFN